MINLYETIGYECKAVSAVDESVRETLAPLLKDKTTLFSGNSGVGKSTLLNNLILV